VLKVAGVNQLKEVYLVKAFQKFIIIQEVLEIGEKKEIKLKNNCPTGKRSYSSSSLAEEALIQSHIIGNHREGNGPKNYYKCDYCGNWHLTSKGDVSLINGDVKKRIEKEKKAYEWERKFK